MTGTTAPTLPAAFMLIAEAALVSGGRDRSTAGRLQDVSGFVAPILALDNLFARKKELTNAVDEYLKSCGRAGVTEKNFPVVANAVEVGLVAGFLIARMLDEREAKR